HQPRPPQLDVLTRRFGAFEHDVAGRITTENELGRSERRHTSAHVRKDPEDDELRLLAGAIRGLAAFDGRTEPALAHRSERMPVPAPARHHHTGRRFGQGNGLCPDTDGSALTAFIVLFCGRRSGGPNVATGGLATKEPETFR